MARRAKEVRNLYIRSGIWYARAVVNGSEYRQSLKTSDRKEAERRLKTWIAGLSPYHGTTRHTWESAVVAWWEANSHSWKLKTEEGYAKILRILDRHFADHFWDQIDKARLQKFMADRLAEGATIATINRNLSVISGIANHVRELAGWPEDNPVERLPKKLRREKRSPFVRPTPDCIDRILSHMRMGTFRDLCQFALLTGLRRDEIVNLEWRHALGGEVQIFDQKNRQAAIVPLSDEAQAIVERQIPGKSPYLFSPRDGDKYLRVTEMWRETVKRAVASAEKDKVPFTPMRFHDLRHEYAIRYLRNGGSLYSLQKLLRHSTIGQTEWYLAYLTPEQAEQSRR